MEGSRLLAESDSFVAAGTTGVSETLADAVAEAGFAPESSADDVSVETADVAAF
jgi:hypothetical protein